MLDALELLGMGRYNSNQYGPIGTYVNLRTMGYYQQASDGNVPADGTYMLIATSATLNAGQVASTVNGLIGTTFVAASFHTRSSGDAVPVAGQATNDG
jgi:hypothetical protein